MQRIRKSVGKNGANIRQDVLIVQPLINNKIHLLKPLQKLKVNGFCGPKTIMAIQAYQKKVMKFSFSDGRIDPYGKTFNSLKANVRKITITGKPIDPKAKKVLTEILQSAGLEKAKVTSGVRTPEDQARIMYDNSTFGVG